MSYNLIYSLDNAIKRCDGMFIIDGLNQDLVYQIYPFTTENISGYIDLFDLNNKSLLTVGSSGDQIINAIYRGCNDITLVDINPYAKYYYYLKVACILCLNKEEFLSFLRYKDYPKVFKDNKNVFNIETFNYIKSTLRLLDYESYLFWDELFQTFNRMDIRNRIISNDEYRTYVIEECNLYLQNSFNYETIKRLITKVNPKFVNKDISKVKLDRLYDNIWLSNIGSKSSIYMTKKIADNMNNYLDENGLMLISYLYRTTKDTKYNKTWLPTYDLKRVRKRLENYNYEIESFLGVDGIKFNEEDFKDSILLYKKKINY